MSYPHIDPKTYLKLLEHDIGNSPEHFGQPRIFAVESRASDICDMLRGFPMSALKGMRAVLRRTKNSDTVVRERVKQP